MYRVHADVVDRIRVLSASTRGMQQNVLREGPASRTTAAGSERPQQALARACAELAAEKATLLE
jgi:hypothetical protein